MGLLDPIIGWLKVLKETNLTIRRYNFTVAIFDMYSCRQLEITGLVIYKDGNNFRFVLMKMVVREKQFIQGQI